MFRSEFEMRQAGTWNESEQTCMDTICPYCAVAFALPRHVQDNTIVKVTSGPRGDLGPPSHQRLLRLAIRAEAK